MQISKFDKQTLPTLRAAIDAALKNINAEFGVNVKLGNMTYAPDGFSFSSKVTGEIKNGASEAARKETAKRWLANFDLKLDQEFRYAGKTFKIVDFDLKARDKNVVVLCAFDSKRYKFDPIDVANILKKEPVK